MNKQSSSEIPPCHDFLLERKWLVKIGGFGETKSGLYSAYVALIFVYMLYLVAMTAYGLATSTLEILQFVDAAHTMVIVVFALWGLTTRLLTDKAIYKIRGHINAGFYTYDEEALVEEQTVMKKEVVEEVRKKTTHFVNVWYVTGLTLGVLFPVSQMLMITPEEYEKTVDIASPYFASIFFMPFGTREIGGFAAAYAIVLVFYFYLIGSGILMNEIYLSCIMQLHNELRILNHSIRQIHKRAAVMYVGLKGIPVKEMSLDEFYGDVDYQKCLFKCLRSNVQHHQILLRFNKEFLKFGGSLILLIFNIASLAFASNIFPIMQKTSVNTMVKCLVALVADQSYTLYLCIFGELIMQESSSLFESLYSIPWFYYNKGFNQTLQVFMCYTMKPIRIKSLILDLTASLESYANLMSVMYKILNVWMQSAGS